MKQKKTPTIITSKGTASATINNANTKLKKIIAAMRNMFFIIV
jgi:hypothetical protein